MTLLLSSTICDEMFDHLPLFDESLRICESVCLVSGDIGHSAGGLPADPVLRQAGHHRHHHTGVHHLAIKV